MNDNTQNPGQSFGFDVAFWTSIEECPGLSTRTLRALERAGVSSIRDLLWNGEEGLLRIKGFGEKSLEIIRSFLQHIGAPTLPKESGTFNFNEEHCSSPELQTVWHQSRETLDTVKSSRRNKETRIKEIELEVSQIRNTIEELQSEARGLQDEVARSHVVEAQLCRTMKFIEEQAKVVADEELGRDLPI